MREQAVKPVKGRESLLRGGSSLLECLLGMALVAGALPLVMSGVFTVQKEEARVRTEKQAIALARVLFSEFPQVWQGGGVLLEGQATFPQLPNGTSREVLVLAPNQQQAAEAAQWSLARISPSPGAAERSAFVAILEIKEQKTKQRAREGSLPSSVLLAIRLEYPAGRPAPARDLFTFTQRVRRP